MKSDIIMSACLISTGVYAWAYSKGHKEKIAPWLGYKKLVLLCIVMILGGVLIAIGDILEARR
jgi:hypothetical protein